MSKLSRGIKGERKVAATLQSLNLEHYVFNDVTLINATSKMTHQIDHILIHPHGLFVIETKNYSGTVSVDEATGNWFKTLRHVRSKISSPLLQNKAHAIALRKAIKSKYKPIPVVVFTQNNAPYLADENVINLDDLPLFIDSYPYARKYTSRELTEMKALIESVSAKVTLKEHLENIATMKKAQKETKADMTYAIERGLCPECDHQLVIHGYEYRCPHCGYHFKL